MKRTILAACFLIAVDPLLFGVGIVVKWAVECGGGACAGTVQATSPFGTPRDVILTALVVAAPYLLAVLIAAGMWLLAMREARQLAAPPSRPGDPWRSRKRLLDYA